MESARIEMEQYDIETYYKYMYRNGDVNDIFSDCVSDLYDFAYTQRHTIYISHSLRTHFVMISPSLSLVIWFNSHLIV